MKIAHVVDSMEVGGAEVLVSQMCRLQRERGDAPQVFAIASLGPLGEQLRREGFRVEANMGRHLLDSMRSFYGIFKSERPDVVHLHNPTPTVYAAMAARLAGVPSIISTRHSLVAPPRRKMVEAKYAVASRFCDWVVGICVATTNNVRSLHTVPRRKIARVYNGAVGLTRVPLAHCPTKAGFTLVFVGRLAAVKNHPLLLRAFADALSVRPDLRLWMVGDGPERAGLEKLAAELGLSEQVKFWGQQLDVAPFFSAADVFIMSSKSEGLPMSLLQAFSLGVPAVVTNVGGMAEVVRLAKGGITVDPLEPGEMTAAILRLASGDEEREQFSLSAKTAFEERFTLQAMVNAYDDLYRNTSRAKRVMKR